LRCDNQDPLPRVKFARPGLRRRLKLGRIHYGEEQRMPPSLRFLYSELAHARDYNADVDSLASRIRKDKQMEVFVKSPEDEWSNLEEPRANGDCPYSQRVLIALEELGFKYTKTAVPLRAKPSWFHLLHPEGSVPVIYHQGCLIADSRHIVGYLLEQFPKARELLGTNGKNMKIAVGTMTFTRFYVPFLAAMRGESRALGEMQRELRKLNDFVQDVQERFDGPFIGGHVFSREDTAVVPMLHRLAVAGPALLGPDYGIPDDCGALKTYLNAAMERESFIKTAPADDVVVAGFRTLRNEGTMMWLADILE
jgi:glutathione S-transferase